METTALEVTVVSPKVFEYHQIHQRNGRKIEFTKQKETEELVEFIRFTVDQNGKRKKTGKIDFCKTDRTIKYTLESWPILSMYTVNLMNTEEDYYQNTLSKICSMEG